MRLIIGGAYQGKLDYTLEMINGSDYKIVDGKSLLDFFNQDRPFEQKQLSNGNDNIIIVNRLHLFIKDLLTCNIDVDTMIDRLTNKTNSQIIFIVNELGAGIVPIEAFDRKWREIVGRTCCKLAAEAEEVHRVFCGLGIRLK